MRNAGHAHEYDHFMCQIHLESVPVSMVSVIGYTRFVLQLYLLNGYLLILEGAIKFYGLSSFQQLYGGAFSQE
jgi:hypothetical protein